MPVHDFRSDTVTLPTAAMMAAIAGARLGDAARGDDPTVAELERLAREATGKEDALLVPSGTMANLAAIIAHECRGGEVVVEQDAHIYNAEGGGLSALAGAIARPVRGTHGILSAEQVRTAIRGSDDAAHAATRLVCLESTHNVAGGCVYPLEVLAANRAVARAAGVPVHLDGARLFNAATYLDVPLARICQHADSLWFSLCKGLRGPVGAILAGDAAFMRRARRAVRMLGGAMRQAGVIAAPAIVALRDDPYAIHRRDHHLARALASGIAGIDRSLVDLDTVQTNIVNCFVDAYATDARGITDALRERSVLAIGRASRIRFVTHAGVDGGSVEAAVDALAQALGSLAHRSPTQQEAACRHG
ncbi:MAG TPA: GntG family PLP-dependent aldolase [Casimicrobiaceae bacterium]|nr:GntG family PLP-dependent aldolase [Casimicrobiaceae bacterium]